MSTRVKIIISVIAVTIILALIAIGIVLVVTSPVHNMKDSTFIIKYQGGVAGDVKVVMENHNLYLSDETNSTMIDKDERVNFAMTSIASGETDAYDIGMFNKGQLMDISKADTTMTVSVALSDSTVSNPMLVKLEYNDTHDTDTNIRLVVSAVYRSSSSQYAVPAVTYTLNNNVWNTSTIFQGNTILRDSGYTSVDITVIAEIVSYDTEARLDGEFTLSMIGA